MESLRRKFDPNYYKQQLKKALAKKFQPKAEEKPKAAGGLEAIEHLRETKEDEQKKQPEENIEKPALLHVCTLAYNLLK